MLSPCAVREVAMGFFTMKSHSAAFAWAMAALALSCDAAAGDFIFGEDFEGVPACTGGTGFSIGATPPARTGSLGTQHRYLVKLHACNVSGTATLDKAEPRIHGRGRSIRAALLWPTVRSGLHC